MPTIYLSPSTQEGNMYVTGNSEEYWMNRLADAMEPYLEASGISFTRNSPTGSAARSIRESNSGNYDLHLALHSNAAPPDIYGQVQGSDVYYYPSSVEGRRAANIIADALKTIYPDPNKVRALANTSIGELRQVRAPSVFLELAYHDNVDDANWITSNLDLIARTLVLALTEYFGIPFREPGSAFPRPGLVSLSYGTLNLRQEPSLTARVVASIPNGTILELLGETGDWYEVNYNGTSGYVSKAFVTAQ
ncbi:MAG: SH3 domain-containing protein [Oscillospiraceae bacterium]|nr:SH3 domain-containing protein [Oscillospiraceae bacterium]